MAKKPKVDLSSVDTSKGELQHKFAGLVAKEIDGDIAPTIRHLADIRAEYEGGPFVVLRNILGTMTETTYQRLPPPHVDTGNNPSVYKIKVRKGKNETLETYDFYKDGITEQLPSVIAALAEKDLLQRSLGDPTKVNQSDIPELMKNTPIHTRQARINKLSKIVSTARRNVVAAFELHFQLEAMTALPTVTTEIVFALDENNQPLDGEDGREYKVEDTSTPIVLTSTVKGRAGIDTKQISLNTFNKIDIAKAKESPGGPTYQALLNTVAKGADSGLPTAGITIETVPTFFNVVNDVSSFLDKVLVSTDKAQLQAIEKTMASKGKEGNALEDADLAFYNIRSIVDALRPFVSDPVSDVRYQALLNRWGDGKAKPKPRKAA